MKLAATRRALAPTNRGKAEGDGARENQQESLHSRLSFCCLFVSQCVDWVELRGLDAWEQAEDDADERREDDGDEDRRNADGDRNLHDEADNAREDDADDDAEDAAEETEHGGLREKLGEDLTAAGAERLFQADLARALRDGDEHDVHARPDP